MTRLPRAVFAVTLAVTFDAGRAAVTAGRAVLAWARPPHCNTCRK